MHDAPLHSKTINQLNQLKLSLHLLSLSIGIMTARQESKIETVRFNVLPNKSFNIIGHIDGVRLMFIENLRFETEIRFEICPSLPQTKFRFLQI